VLQPPVPAETKGDGGQGREQVAGVAGGQFQRRHRGTPFIWSGLRGPGLPGPGAVLSGRLPACARAPRGTWGGVPYKAPYLEMRKRRSGEESDRLDKRVADGDGGGFPPIGCSQLAQDVADVVAGCLGTNEEGLRDLRVGQARPPPARDRGWAAAGQCRASGPRLAGVPPAPNGASPRSQGSGRPRARHRIYAVALDHVMETARM
jgi:hypothetical protein